MKDNYDFGDFFEDRPRSRHLTQEEIDMADAQTALAAFRFMHEIDGGDPEQFPREFPR